MSANSWTGRPLPAAGLPGAGQLADVWMDAVLGTSYVAMRRVDLRDYLTDLADDLFVAVTEWELDRSIPRGVGAAMVSAHFTDAISLELTLLVLEREFGRAVATPPQAARVAAVQAALASGYAEALQALTRAEQERIGVAAFAARASAEQARWTSEARFQAVFDGALIGISVIDTAGCILEVNRRCASCSATAPTSSFSVRCSPSRIPTTIRRCGCRSRTCSPARWTTRG